MEEQRENKLGVLPIPQLIRQFAVPSIVAMLVGALYNIVDQFFIGRSIGELGNAATNVAFPLTTSCTAIALLIGIGGAASFNLSMGRKEHEKAVHYMGNAAVLLFGLGLILCVGTQIFLTPMLRFFGSPDSVLSYAIVYTRITSIGFPFLIFSNGGAHLVRADGTPQYAMICNLAGAGINTVLDPLFIFGFQMGMAGAAFATIIGQITAAGMVFRYLCHCKTVTLHRAHLIVHIENALQIMSLGLSSFFNQIAMMVVQIVLNNSLTYYGSRSIYGESVPLACAGIISKVAMLYFSVVIGLAQGLQPIASFNYGAKQYDRVKYAYGLTVRYAVSVSACAFVLFQLFPRQIISVFGDGSEEYFLFAVRYFRIFLFATFLNGVQPVTATFFTAIGKPIKGVFLSLTRQILFLLPLIVIFPLFLGIDGIMYAGPIADLVAGAVAIGMMVLEMRQITRLERARTTECIT
ncbi:MAG: MATE family efflux transporter [Lachnospiraceae bacterium]|jgi:Na+-driven multidrug efflux pump|nr:MATE family efflux transporter [Lachnospiraceae bacterium]